MTKIKIDKFKEMFNSLEVKNQQKLIYLLKQRQKNYKFGTSQFDQINNTIIWCQEQLTFEQWLATDLPDMEGYNFFTDGNKIPIGKQFKSLVS